MYCPYYMALGMTYDQYWYGEPEMVKFFSQAQVIKNEQLNQEMFIMGHYVFQAISVALSNLNLSGKPRTPNKYLQKPFELTNPSKEAKEKRAEEARQRIIAGLTAWKNAWDNSHSS